MGLKTSSRKKNVVQKPNNQPRISGIYWKRTKQRIRNNDLVMATWNVCTIRWLGHVERMEVNTMPKRMLKGRLYSKRRKGRPRMRWLEEVENDLKRMEVTGWKEMRNREQWRLVVEEAKAHPGL
jgi:hypothetical protein